MVDAVSLETVAGGLRFRVLHWAGDAGRLPFLLLHGLASNARFWEPVGGRLAEAGHTVFAPDLRGHGLSQAPADGYDFDSIAGDLAGLVTRLEVPGAVIAGHSWGGLVALDYAGRASPAGLALIDGGFTQLSDSPGATWEKVEAALTPPRLVGTPVSDFLAYMEAAHRDWAPGVPWKDIVLANFEIRKDGTLSPHLSFENHMQVVRAMWAFKTYAHFDDVRCPVLIAAARRAGASSRREQAFIDLKRRGEREAQARLKRLRFVWMYDTDHDIPLHRPAELAELLLGLARSAEAG